MVCRSFYVHSAAANSHTTTYQYPSMQGIHRVSGVVRLSGEQYVYNQNKRGRHQLSAVLGREDLQGYEEEREELIKIGRLQKYNDRKKLNLQNDYSKRDLADGKCVYTFRWGPDTPMPIWDASRNKLTQPAGLNSGAKVCLCFQQQFYGQHLPEAGPERQHSKPQHGTTLRLLGIQVIEEVASDGMPMTEDDIANLFEVRPGFIRSEPTGPNPQVISIQSRDIEGLNGHRLFERPRKLRS